MKTFDWNSESAKKHNPSYIAFLKKVHKSKITQEDFGKMYAEVYDKQNISRHAPADGRSVYRLLKKNFGFFL
jgi:hypothetical protein